MEVNGCFKLSGYHKYLLLCSMEQEAHTGLEKRLRLHLHNNVAKMKKFFFVF